MEFKKQGSEFEEIATRVRKIANTEVTTQITEANQNFVTSIERFSDYGLSTLGNTVNFPAKFVKDIFDTNAELATQVVKDRVKLYFEKKKTNFYAREFEGKIRGIVSNEYSYFDDYQVIDILENSPLANLKFKNNLISPERFHTRAVDYNEPFVIGNDTSPLFFAYFIDNSMVGQSSFKVQLGIYRLACTNGMILPVRDFVICRQIHRGNKDISKEFNQSIEFLVKKKNDIKELITNMSLEKATIETLKEEFRKDYISKKLGTNQKETQKIFDLYEGTYDGQTKWGMANAITEFARDLQDINRREFIEKAAFKAA